MPADVTRAPDEAAPAPTPRPQEAPVSEAEVGPFSAGARVRARDPEGFVRELEKKLENRVGTVQATHRVESRFGGTSAWKVRVLFDARRKGGKSFEITLSAQYLELASGEPRGEAP